MPEFDRYVERLRQRAGISLSAEAERELRAHFDGAVAAHLAAGVSERAAESAALDELGRPEIVARAFRRERRVLWRLADGPAGAIAPLWLHWRRLLAATTAAALLGAGLGRLLPPSYDASVAVAAVALHYDYGSGLAVADALTQLRQERALHIDPATWQGTARAAASRPGAAAARAEAAAQSGRAAFAAALAQATSDGTDASLQIAAAPIIAAHYPIAPAAAAGGAAGLLSASALTLRGRRHRSGSR